MAVILEKAITKKKMQIVISRTRKCYIKEIKINIP